MSSRACKRCHTPFEGQEVEAIFRANRGGRQQLLPTSRSTCICCELSARTEKKRDSRTREKARRAIRTHFEKYRREHVEQGKHPWMANIRTQKEFADRFGWDVDQMAHDIEHAHQNGCPYCRESFSSMAHGLADVSFDVIDPERQPYYRTNVRPCCLTCNREKARTPPELWGAKLQAWERWRRWTADEFPPDSLFGNWTA